MMLKSLSETDWLSPSDQQAWFEAFKPSTETGLRIKHFQEFLNATIYAYLRALNTDSHQNASLDEDENKEIRFTYEQELQLFKLFDSNGDQVIDKDEFVRLSENWLQKVYRRACSALVVVDVQNDFIDGSLALINGPAKQDGAEVVPIINGILDHCQFDAVVYTQDWHPPDHIGFHENLHLRKYNLKLSDDLNGIGTDQNSIKSSNPSKFKLKKLATKVGVYDTVLFDEGRMEQKLWPTHCIQNSWGADLSPELTVKPNSIRIYKGTLAHVDAYSAFWDNQQLNETGLRQELVSRKVTDVFFCGLALDYCVSASAIDAAKAGFLTFVIEDACRGIDLAEMERRKAEMIEYGILIVNSESVNGYLLQSDCRGVDSIISDSRNHDDRNHNEKRKLTAKQVPTTISRSSPSKFCRGFDSKLMLDICFKRASLRSFGSTL